MAPFGSDKFKAIMQCIHGVDNCSNMPETVEKRKQTSLTRRGVECPFQDKIVKDKITSTLQTWYGENVVNPSMIPGNRKKMVENMRAAGKSFGAQNAAYKINFFAKHGVDHYAQTEEAKFKISGRNEYQKNDSFRQTIITKIRDTEIKQKNGWGKKSTTALLQILRELC